MDKQSKEVQKVERQLKKVIGCLRRRVRSVASRATAGAHGTCQSCWGCNAVDYSAQVSRRQRFYVDNLSGVEPSQDIVKPDTHWKSPLNEMESELTLVRKLSVIVNYSNSMNKHCTNIDTIEQAVRKRLEKAQSFFVFHEESQLKEGRSVFCGSTSHPLKKMADPDKYQKALKAQQQLEKQRSHFEMQLQSERAKSDVLTN